METARKLENRVFVYSEDLENALGTHSARTMTEYIDSLIQEEPTIIHLEGEKSKRMNELFGRLLVMTLTRDYWLVTNKQMYDKANNLFHDNIEIRVGTGYRVRPKPSKAIAYFQRR